MVLIFLTPLYFITPRFDITEDTSELSQGVEAYNISCRSLLPIRYVTAYIGDDEMAVIQISDNNYRVEPTVNGEMTVKVTFLNMRSSARTVTVSTVDRSAPYVTNYTKDENYLYIYAEDKGSGIDYDSCYCLTSDNEKLMPVSYDNDTGCLQFEYTGEDLNLYLYDKVGNRLRLLVTVG